LNGVFTNIAVTCEKNEYWFRSLQVIEV